MSRPPPSVRPPLSTSAFRPTSAPVTAPPHSAACVSSSRTRISTCVAMRSSTSRSAVPPRPCRRISASVFARASASSPSASAFCASTAGVGSAWPRPMAAPAWRMRVFRLPLSGSGSALSALRARLAASCCIDASNVATRRSNHAARKRAMSSCCAAGRAACTAPSSACSCTQQRANASSGSTARTMAKPARWRRQRASSASGPLVAERGAPSWFSSTITGLPTQPSNSISGAT